MERMIKIKDAFVFLRKSKIKAGDGLVAGKYPFYTSSSVLSKYLDSYEIEEESLIFGTGGSASVHHSHGKFSSSTDCFVVQSNNKYEINLRYVYLFLSGNIHILENGFKGAGLKHISKKYLEDVEIPLPPIETQKKIVEVLDKAQGLIDARKEQIRLMDELIQSVFYEMFGDPVTNPKGWEQMKLKKSCNVITGNTPSRKEPDNYGDYIEWIKSDNINTPYTFLTRAEEYLSEKGLEKGRFTEANSILMTCIAGSLSCIGNVAIADRRVAFNQQINAIVPLKYEKMFLYVIFLLTKSYIQNASSNSMKGMISKGKLQELQFIVPDRTLQELFEVKALKLEEQKELLKQSLNELELNYYSLVKNAFNGELF
ncbi:type I restriction enzyme S subunit [Natranaerovirga hydrolytica]|uniref:Type I restriction enzyme S subunit n=1 Tax=Natranaerovirga hydrolytica TaxID=680378 RepID=A0A4R1MPX2_9FIRM|nr:restriction endonuclease subunit S [Natranaerovirga hydrolytica]TCK92559.1 type I restriction enzyme S subunit [Natranaerovirga hydrolytica]